MERLIPENGPRHTDVVSQEGVDIHGVEGKIFSSANNPYFSPEEKIAKLLEELNLAQARIEMLEAKNASLLAGVQNLEIEKIEAQAKVAELENLAMKDPLTGLPNRRAFDEKQSEIQSKNKRLTFKGTYEDVVRQGYSILAFDLDHFKEVNDKYGHDVGDRCLKIIAKVVRSVLRDTDTFAREGGDEFLVLLPDIGEHGARIVGEKILHAIELEVNQLMSQLAEVRGNVTHVSASIGAVGYGDKMEGDKDLAQEDMVKVADYIRYVVKAAGKKGVLTFKEALLIDGNRVLWNQFCKKVKV